MGWFTDLLDGGASSAKKANMANALENKANFNQASSFGEMFLLKAMNNIDTSFANASANLGKAGETATTQILGQSKQALAAGQQALTDSGFGGTIAAALPGQVAAQTNQALAGLAEGVGAQQASLDTQYAGMKLASAQSMADWALGVAKAKSASLPQHSAAGGGLLGGLGTGLGKLAGTWAGGLFASTPTPEEG